MCQDIEKGRRTEIECVLGAVLELAELTSSNATNLKCVYACVKLLEFVVDRHHVSIKPLNRGAD
jgi:ketopantoate reductase